MWTWVTDNKELVTAILVFLVAMLEAIRRMLHRPDRKNSHNIKDNTTGEMSVLAQGVEQVASNGGANAIGNGNILNPVFNVASNLAPADIKMPSVSGEWSSNLQVDGMANWYTYMQNGGESDAHNLLIRRKVGDEWETMGSKRIMHPRSTGDRQWEVRVTLPMNQAHRLEITCDDGRDAHFADYCELGDPNGRPVEYALRHIGK